MALCLIECALDIHVFWMTIFICGFSKKVTWTFLASETIEELIELNTFSLNFNIWETVWGNNEQDEKKQPF